MKTYMSNPSFYLFLFFLIAIQQIQSQVIEPTTNKSSQELYDFYTLKQKKNKTAAWIFLGSGLAVTAVGFEIGNKGDLDDIGTTGLLVVLGGATTLASVPFFIAAGKNKRKAWLSLKKVQNSVGNINFDNSNYLSVSITIPI